MMRSSQNTAATVFQAWRHRIADKTAARTAVRHVINRLQGVRNSQAFAAWQAFVQQQQAQKAQLQKAVVRLQRLRCSNVLYHWQQHVAQRKAVQSRLARAFRCCFWLALNDHAFRVRSGAATYQIFYSAPYMLTCQCSCGCIVVALWLQPCDRDSAKFLTSCGHIPSNVQLYTYGLLFLPQQQSYLTAWQLPLLLQAESSTQPGHCLCWLVQSQRRPATCKAKCPGHCKPQGTEAAC